MKLTSRFADALACAVDLHAGQCRKVSGTPYLAHLLRVAGIVMEHGGTEDEAIAAVLHDAIEDQGGVETRETLLAQFGPTVVGIIDECSDSVQTPKPPWRRRKQAHLERLRDASASAHLITAADKLDNVHSLLQGCRQHGESFWDHFRGGREGTLWYHRSMVSLLETVWPNPLVGELDRAVTELEAISVLQSA